MLIKEQFYRSHQKDGESPMAKTIEDQQEDLKDAVYKPTDKKK